MVDVKEYANKTNKTKLKQAYMEACSNKDFYEYVSKLPVVEDVLIKYTSTLEECYLEYSNSSKCKNIASCKNKVNGYCFTPEKKEKGLVFSYVCCAKKEKYDQENKYLNNIKYF